MDRSEKLKQMDYVEDPKGSQAIVLREYQFSGLVYIQYKNGKMGCFPKSQLKLIKKYNKDTQGSYKI